MGSIKTSTGLASGIDISALVKALLVNHQNAVSKLQNRLTGVQASQAGLTQIQASLLSITTAAQQLGNRSTFQSLRINNTSPAQLTVGTTSQAAPGVYEFQTIQLATNHRSISRGYANAEMQPLGVSGELVIGTGGGLSRPAALDLLNGGEGVRRGAIRITDRSGASAIVDLKNALTIEDVTAAINAQNAISVRAATQGGRLVLEDLSGQTATNLSVTDINGGRAAADLGIARSVAGSTLTGDVVYRLSEDVPLSVINDGNGVRLRTGAPDVTISLRDGTTLDIDLDGSFTLGDVIHKINSDAANNGKLTAALADGRLELTDHTGGSGTLSVASLPGSNAAAVLGLNRSAPGDVLTGQALSGGLNSVLLRNLRGGQGIELLGRVSLTDRTGATAIIDLSQAETLDDVLTAINTAAAPGNGTLQVRAALDARGTGVVITDTSGQAASNLVIADLDGGTVARDLKIAVDGAVDRVASGSLGLQSVNEATSLDRYAPNGGRVSSGSFSITNSAGATAVINIGSMVRTIGDVLDRINGAGINVTARLNETGDGFVLIDEAGGAGTLAVKDIGGTPAAHLRLTGSSAAGSDGKQRIVSRLATVVQVADSDTLAVLSTKINSAGGAVRATVVDSGAAINPYRLSLASTVAGRAGRLIIDDGSLGLNFTDQAVGKDAVLRIGSDPTTAFLKTSATNVFANAVSGYNVTLLTAGDQPAVVTGSRDTDVIQTALTTFVNNYNSLVDQIKTLTKYDSATGTRGALQGDATVLQVQTRILSLVNRVTGAAGSPIRSLADVGVTVGGDGKLRLDANRFQRAASDHPQELTQFFVDSTSGFGSRLNKLLNDLNDPNEGSLTAAVKAEETTARQLQSQIERVNATMAARQAFLESQFANMEKALSGLQSQQEALTALAQLATAFTTSSKK